MQVNEAETAPLTWRHCTVAVVVVRSLPWDTGMMSVSFPFTGKLRVPTYCSGLLEPLVINSSSSVLKNSSPGGMLGSVLLLKPCKESPAWKLLLGRFSSQSNSASCSVIFSYPLGVMLPEVFSESSSTLCCCPCQAETQKETGTQNLTLQCPSSVSQVEYTIKCNTF